MSTKVFHPRLRRLTVTVDVALAISMILFTLAAVSVGWLIVRGLWPPRSIETPSLHSGVQ